MLREAGHVVVKVPGGAEAARAIRTPGLDYLVLDLRMPLLDRQALQQALDPAQPGEPDSLEGAERRHIAVTLCHTGGNRRRAAEILGIARSTMLAKLRKYGLDWNEET